jgi:hypothetical protein
MLYPFVKDIIYPSHPSVLRQQAPPAWLAQAQPCASLPIRVNPSQFDSVIPTPSPFRLPCGSLPHTCPGAWLWLKNDFAVNDFA